MADFAFAVILATIIAICNAAPEDQCAKELQNAGASAGFDAIVAHGVHSMTVDTLRMFDATATEDNYVPTIDLDLRSDQAILPYAPIRKTNDTDSFLTEGMKILDLVLSHMNEDHWDVVGFDPLERVVHAFHMREVWAHAKVVYDKLGKSLPAPSATACQCALDIENNGIMKSLRFTAMALREPSLVYGDPKYSNRDQKSVGYPIGYTFNLADKNRGTKEQSPVEDNSKKGVGYPISYNFNLRNQSTGSSQERSKVDKTPKRRRRDTANQGSVAGYPITYNFNLKDKKGASEGKPMQDTKKRQRGPAGQGSAGRDVAYSFPIYNFPFRKSKKANDQPIDSLLLKSQDQAMPPLVDSKSWKYWAGTTDPPMDHKDLALFMYCALAKGRVDLKKP